MSQTAKLWMRDRARSAEAGVAGDRHREGDQAEDGRELEPLGDDPDAEAGDELEQVAAERPGDEGHDEAAEEECEQDPEDHAARHRDGDAEREGSVAGFVAVERDGGREDQQRRGVVEQALALQHRHYPAGMLTPPRIAVAAAASGGATMAPSASAA